MRAIRAAVLAVLAATVAACGGSQGFHGIYSLPLPGGASLGSHPYQVTAQFADVTDLTPQATVKVNDVQVGRVAGISVPARKWYANVTMVINGGVHLPANAIAELTQGSLLGEKYVALSAPPGKPGIGTLGNHGTISLASTTTNASVEQVLGAMSLLFNDGGLQQLHTIDVELGKALNGNEPQIHSVFIQLSTLVSNLNAHRSDITQAIDGLNRLGGTLAARDQQIGNVLANLSPGMQIAAQQRNQFVTMLNALHKLSGIAVSTINQSKADSIADLQALAPTLRQLANAGQALPNSLQLLLTFPFTNQLLNDVKGDYLNIYLTLASSGKPVITCPIPIDTGTDNEGCAITPGASANAQAGAAPNAALPLPSIGASAAPSRSPSSRSPSRSGSTSPGRTGGQSPGGPASSPPKPSQSAPGTPGSSGSPQPTGSPTSSAGGGG